MNKKFKGVIFDIDGTLTDSGEGIIKSVKYALAAFGMEENDEKRLRSFIGPPLFDSFTNLYGVSRERANELIEKWRERFRVKGIYENKLYDGIEELLKDLKDAEILIGVASAKPEVFALDVLRYFNILKYFDAVAGTSLENEDLDKSVLIGRALKKMNISDKKTAVMVGDRCYDIDGAKKAGVPSIGVLYGYGSKNEIESSGADYIADSVQELRDILI